MAAVAEVFHALGDPVRLELVQRLAQRQPCTIAAVSSGLGITRQGVRKHLQVLADAKLVVLVARGREVHVQLDASAFEHARAFFDKLERQWDKRLEALKRFVEQGE
jgi:DNA-binding transcriptional ArsR family regulator